MDGTRHRASADPSVVTPITAEYESYSPIALSRPETPSLRGNMRDQVFDDSSSVVTQSAPQSEQSSSYQPSPISSRISAAAAAPSRPVSYGMARRGQSNAGPTERRRMEVGEAERLRQPEPPLPPETWRDDPALLAADWDCLTRFHRALEAEKMQTCERCSEWWFHMGLDADNVCASCLRTDSKRQSEEPFLFSAENFADPGEFPAGLPALSQVEEMLIARVHVFVEVRQYKGVQYSYRGHIVNFLANTGKIYSQLPLLPGDLDIILLKPANTRDFPRVQRQFKKDYQVRRSVVRV